MAKYKLNMNQVTIHSPQKLLFGVNAFGQIPELIIEMGAKRVFILTFAEIEEVVKKTLSPLDNKNIELNYNYSIVKEPTVTDFKTILDETKAFMPDLVLGVGGGSVLDVAKLIAALTYGEQKIDDVFGINILKGREAKLVCVSTTSGTGSEMSPNAIVLDEKENLKKGIISPYLVPDVTCIDPVLTFSVPKAVTAATGVDAFTHCFEAYINKFAHPLIDTYALDGMKYIFNNLVLAVENGNDIEARSAVAMGSMYGGMCLGPVNTTAIHALSYPLGSEFHVAHGLSNALLLPAVMEFNASVSEQRYANIGKALGIAGESDSEIAINLIKEIKIWLKKLNIPSGMSAINIPKEVIPDMANAAMSVQRLLKNNPREVNLNDAIEIYNNAY